MAEYELKGLTTLDLLKLYAGILEELYERNVIRTRNNPVSDYGEWIVARGLSLNLEPNSHPGFDATGPDGKKYQIKSRRITRENTSRQLGVIRDLETKKFDYLIGIVFDKTFGIREAYKIPHDVIHEFGWFSDHTRGYILHLRGALLTAPGVEDITDKLRNAAQP